MRATLSSRLRSLAFGRAIRHVSSKPGQPAGAASTAEAMPTQQRIDRMLRRTPKFLHRHVIALRSRPVSHVTAFLLLHELTAIVPLFGLAGAFHYYNWLPPYFAEGAWVVAGVEKFGRYFRRKGWISDEVEHEIEQEAAAGEDMRKIEKGAGPKSAKAGSLWNTSEGGVRLVVEFATAYTIVKALIIPRLFISAWLAPSFARWTVIPVVKAFRSSRVVQAISKRAKGVTPEKT